MGSFHDGLGFISCFFIHVMVCVKVLKNGLRLRLSVPYFVDIFKSIFTRGQLWPSDIVIAYVCVCVCVLSVCQSLACPCDNLGPV